MEKFVITFDGGSKGNPGPAYGSFHIKPWSDPEGTTERLSFGDGTNNEAEYLSLIAALRFLLAFLAGRSQDPNEATVEIRGDSQLILRQVKKQWKAKDKRMRALRDEALQLLDRFGRVVVTEQPREKIVEILGH